MALRLNGDLIGELTLHDVMCYLGSGDERLVSFCTGDNITPQAIRDALVIHCFILTVSTRVIRQTPSFK